MKTQICSKKATGSLALLVAVSALSTTTYALDWRGSANRANERSSQILLGEPVSAGTGCPAGSTAAVLSPDQQELSILFDNFVAQTDTLSRKTTDRKNCSIAVPVTVPQGYSIALFQVDYRGYNSLPAGARSQLAIDYFFAGQRGARASRTFTGPLNEDYLVTNHVLASALVWSACGDSTNLRMSVTLNASANSRGENSTATVDSADISAGLLYHIQWRRCGDADGDRYF